MGKFLRRNKGIMFFIVMVLSVVIPLFISNDNTTEVQAKPGTQNMDAYLRNSGNVNADIYRYTYLQKSHFTGNPYSHKYIHEGQRDEGYTCWAYNAQDYEFYDASVLRHPFWASPSRGNEAYGETMVLEQCEDGQKLIEYEIHASDNISNASYNPSMSNATVSGERANYLRFTGWSTLGGFTHHTGWNQSTYVVAVEQVNGRNTNSTNGVHITKAVGNNTSLTNQLQFGNIPKCSSSSATGTYIYEQGKEYNRYRGSLFYSSVRMGDPSVLSFYGNTASEDPNAGALLRHYSANERWYRTFLNPETGRDYNHPVHGLGCNFDYPYAGFTAYLNMDDILGNGQTDKDFKIYLVKRIEDMIVSTEMQTPRFTEEMDIKHGNVTFEGYDDSNTVNPNRTALPKFRGYNSSSWLFNDRENGYLDRNRNYRLDEVIVRSGYPSIYKIRDTNAGRTYYHYAHYFNYNQENEGSTLSYEVTEKPVTVRHYDYFTCPSNVQNNINNNLLSNLTNTDCKEVREKSSGNLARKGDKWYENFTSHTFYTYQGNEVYRTSRANDDFDNMLGNRNIRVIGGGTGHVNFFYINMNEVGSLTVNYIDNQTGDSLRSPHKVSQIRIGSTVSFPVPDRIPDGRTYFKMDNQSNSIKITGDNVVNIMYNPNPNVYFDFIDRDTGNNLGEVRHHHQRGTNFSKTPPSTVTSGGTTYYREESGPITFSSVWMDKRVNVYYTNKKMVDVRHYDYYTCPENVREQRTGDIRNTSCEQLKQKSNSTAANRGSRNYETDMTHKFYNYGNTNNALYLNDINNDRYRAVHPSAIDITLNGMANTYVNFFYINDRDLGNLRVKYVDAITGDTLRSDYVRNNVKKDTTVTYPVPDPIVHTDGRWYYPRKNGSGSVNVTQDNQTLTVEYNYNPNIYVEKVDRDTGKVLGIDERFVNRGGTYNMTPDEMITDNGSNYYREGSGAIQFSNVWDDTTKTEYYSKYKDVTVRHYDYYSCDLSEAENMLGLIEGMGCSRLFEKDTGAWTFKGSGRYETDMEYRFWKYGNAENNLYRTDRVNDNYYAENASSQVVHLRGKDETFINFFYKNRLDEFTLTVEYIDRQTGEKLRDDYVDNKAIKGTTVDYPMPDFFQDDNDRYFYRYGNQTGRAVISGDRTITVKYNYNPRVTINYIDRETGNTIQPSTEQWVERGNTYTSNTPQELMYDNNAHFRVGGEKQLSNLWRDSTITFYYSDMRDVVVNAYDRRDYVLNDTNTPLREISTGNLARQGSGTYFGNQTHRFNAYSDGSLYRNSVSDNYFLDTEREDRVQNINVPLSYETLNSGNPYHVNFYYTSRDDVRTVQVRYRTSFYDGQIGASFIADHDTYYNRFIDTYIDHSEYSNGNIIEDNGRTYDYDNGELPNQVQVENGSGTQVVDFNYDIRPYITKEFVDRDTGEVFHTEVDEILSRETWNFTPPEHYSAGGKTYTLIEEPTNHRLLNTTTDTTIQFEYTEKELLDRPVENVENPDATEGLTDIDELNWYITEEDLITTADIEISGNHSHIFGANVREFYGNNDINYDETTEENTQFTHEEEFTEDNYGDGFRSSHTIDKTSEGKYQVEYDYTFTNYESVIFECIYGESDRCFEWEGVDTEPNTWDTGNIEVTDEDGNVETVPARETYELTVNLGNGVELEDTESFDESDLESGNFVTDVEVGKMFVGSDDEEGQDNVIGNTYTYEDDETNEINSIRENFTIENPLLEDELDTQTATNVNDTVGYIHDKLEDLPLEDTNVSGTYSATVDENLQDTLGIDDDDDDKSTVGLRYDSESEEFKLDKVFGLSKKYGIQVAVGYEDYMDDNEVLDIELQNELERLGLGNDDLVELDYEQSRYFVPIDDPNYLVGDNFTDSITLEGLGASDLTIEYEKDVSYENYLYGNVFDEPIYATQKGTPESVEYENTEKITSEELEEISNYTPTDERDKINLYRIKDDVDLKEFLDNILGD